MSIDFGVNNIASCFSPSLQFPILFTSEKLKSLQKSIHHYYQIKDLRLYESVKERDTIIHPVFQTLSLHVVTLSKKNGIEKIVIGDGFVNNDIFHCFPLHTLYKNIYTLSSLNGIHVLLQDESYTSKVNSLKMEEIKYKSSYGGIRVGEVYYSFDGNVIHADVNASINIYRKYVENGKNKDKVRSMINVKNVKNPIRILL